MGSCHMAPITAMKHIKRERSKEKEGEKCRKRIRFQGRRVGKREEKNMSWKSREWEEGRGLQKNADQRRRDYSNDK